MTRKMFYSLRDDQESKYEHIMHIGRNSTTLEQLFHNKMNYHSIDEEYDEETGEPRPWKTLYVDNGKKPTVEQMISGCMDFQFTIMKHKTPYPTEHDDGDVEYPHMIALTYEKAVKEFKD